MPTKRMNGLTATIDEVVELQELGNLAEDWAAKPHLFESVQFDRFKALCDKYAVDAATLIYVYQSRQFATGHSGELPVEQTAVFEPVPAESNSGS